NHGAGLADESLARPCPPVVPNIPTVNASTIGPAVPSAATAAAKAVAVVVAFPDPSVATVTVISLPDTLTDNAVLSPETTCFTRMAGRIPARAAAPATPRPWPVAT